MVHRLVRWLRAMGFDTAWQDAIADAELVRRSLTEHRHILTLDRSLPKEWRVDNILLLKSERTSEQLAEVISHFDIKRPPELFRRCLICNTNLVRASKDEISAQVPEKIRNTHKVFRYCPSCRKVYWQGSHTERIRAAIENMFE